MDPVGGLQISDIQNRLQSNEVWDVLVKIYHTIHLIDQYVFQNE